VGAVEDGRTLVAEAERLCPDVVVVDISMPALNGMDAARQIKKMDAHI
jgi:CheY-like chemotaxis protein